MFDLIKGWLSLPNLKTISLVALITIVGIAGYLGWCWLDGVLTTVDTQATAINTLNKTIGSKDQQITTLDIAKRVAEEKSGFYAAKAEQLNKESQTNEKHAQEYQKKSNELQSKLRTLQGEKGCAVAPVADSVISMQRESIDSFNAKYSR
ncbi:hypothetical protein DBY68_016885 [Pseudocitrobacter sp. RIT415]|uniref:hypothetical protein n=1 Tax=Pseudocitrobacter sp. RIT415 TaxID=2202163 RepID=UPI000D349B1B|nr:hypothetical protein [Pseudocitrobacter sp. RIT 415]RAU45290.1 hypothetical protein DBY68_016885 [Pseudocitrobacter sp. RIT 415]